MLRNCDECNKVFAHPTRRLCESCYKEAQKAFVTVKEYIIENPGASVATVAQETEVDVEIIYEYIRQGRLNVIPRDVELHCDICGDRINSGRICVKCRSDFKKKPEEPVLEQEEKSRSSRVHYLDQIKKRS